jgi:hypothetical protein
MFGCVEVVLFDGETAKIGVSVIDEVWFEEDGWGEKAVGILGPVRIKCCKDG